MEFTLKTKIPAFAKDIYTAWLSTQGHTDMTGGAATASDQVGSNFTAWDGYISGQNLELEANKKIVQTWGTSEFSENEEDSRVELLLEEEEGETKLTLIHSDLPAHGEQYIQGWEDHYFQPMKSYFK
ncbi:MAG: hypothetical protein GY810_19410 [Aureispira sp.]|nr:hypothetical protein [Aureispira sp.]